MTGATTFVAPVTVPSQPYKTGKFPCLNHVTTGKLLCLTHITTGKLPCLKLRSHERFYVSVAHFIWRATRKKPLDGELVELERVLFQLASDTVIYATANQRWAADGRCATSHVFRVAIASQWLYSPCSSSFQMRLTYLGRMSLV